MEKYNVEIIDWLGFYVGKNLRNEFVSDFEKEKLTKDILKSLTIVPMKYQIIEYDKRTNKNVLKNRLGFNVFKEFVGSKNVCEEENVYVFDKNFNVYKPAIVREETDIGDKEQIKNFKAFDKEIDKYKTSNEFGTFMNLAASGCSLMFNNKGERFYVKTKDLRALWRKGIKSSEQIDELNSIAKNVRKTIDRDVNQENIKNIIEIAK